jgi:hypothetical protein
LEFIDCVAILLSFSWYGKCRASHTQVLDQWGIAYDQPLLLATRQAGAAIEGAVCQSITRLGRLAIDTRRSLRSGRYRAAAAATRPCRRRALRL